MGPAARSSKAGATAYHSMLRAAKALVKLESPSIAGRSAGNRRRISHAVLRHHRNSSIHFAGGKFANYLFAAYEKSNEPVHRLIPTRYLIDEAQLFIDAAHSCYKSRPARRRALREWKTPRWKLPQHVNVKLLVRNPEEVEPRAADPCFFTVGISKPGGRRITARRAATYLAC